MAKLLTAFFIVAGSLAALADTPLWQDVKESSIVVTGRREAVPKVYRTLRLNTAAMEKLLASAPMEFSAAAKNTRVVITLPKADGTLARFEIVESPMLAPSVAAEMPDWKTYSGRGLDDPTATARFSWSKDGFRAYIIGADGAHYVDPYSTGDRANYIAYRKQDLGQEARGTFHCSFDRLLTENGNGEAKASSAADGITAPAAPAFSNGTNLRTYRVAIATTGEYTQNRGGQGAALTDVMNAVNRINLIYERDLAIRLTLVSGSSVIFPDPASDPYNNTDDPAQLPINTTTLNNALGAGGYDIGHFFGTGGGGIAATPCVCSSQKAEGYSARGVPTGDAFWVDYVAHEMGHQFGADHTYNTNENGGCSTRSAQDAYEVASGVTIMSYVGICGQRNLQANAIDNFHIRSITQIFDAFTNGGTGSCGTVTATGNSVPVAGAGASFNIPKQTPFTLTATGTDGNNDALSYSWEEYDLGPASGPNGSPAGSFDVDTDGTLHPLFRPFAPRSSASRTFPSLTYILNNANSPPLTFTGTSPAGAVCPGGDTCVTGENLPTQTRTLNFRVAVRDNKGGISDAGVAINVNAGSGPFVVTAPNTAVTVAGGSQLNVTWNVNNTTAAPVSAANVRISLSTDGGNTFPNILATSTANDGSESVTVTDVATTTARIKVEAVGNIFFDISDANFTITSSGAPPGQAVNVSTRLPAGTGDNALIEGFIVQGPGGSTKKIIVRAIGPSLAAFGITDAVANPTLDIFDATNTKIASNDNWKTTQVGGIITGDQFAEINGSGVAPGNDLESAIVANLTPGSFTAVVRGANNTTGTALVDAFDLSTGSAARLANVATRGLIQPGDKLLIGGFITQSGSVKAVVRAIGPSLAQFGITNALPDTTLELRDQNGAIVRANDDWMTDQKAELEATGLQPTHNLEAALVQTIPAGSYTAQVRGKPEATGTGVVEIYFPQ